jgi:hypothetical protein
MIFYLVFTLILVFYEGIRSVTLFELAIKRWEWGLVSAPLLMALISIGGIVSRPLDRFVTSVSPQLRFWIFVALAVSTLALTPWDISTTASAVLFSTASILYLFLIRVSWSFTNSFVIQYAEQSSVPSVFIALGAISASLGMAIGATVATLFDLSIVPFLVEGGLIFGCAALMRTCFE